MKQIGHWIVVAAAVLTGVVAFGLALAAAVVGPLPAPSPSATIQPSPTAWPLDLGPGAISMPAGADCKACHETTGGVIGVKDIPAIPHPVAQWSNCTACHSNEALVKTAPGHSGIHADQCLVCHTVSLGAAPPPAHAVLPNADCVSCHGVTAPLPADMAHKPRQYCWLCHLSTNLSPDSGWPLVGSPAPSSSAPTSAAPG